MKSETGSDYWKSTGAKFGNFQFRPKSEVVQPSEWIMVGYAIRSAATGPGSTISRVFRGKSNMLAKGVQFKTENTLDEDLGAVKSSKFNFLKNLGIPQNWRHPNNPETATA